MACVSVQTVSRETGISHQPGSFTNNLGAILISITEDTVIHFSIAGAYNQRFAPLSHKV
jgi:hypothetical protein